MSWFSKCWRIWFKKGFFVRITRPWPGEKGLGQPMDKGKKIAKEEVEKEIRDSLHKKEGGKNGIV